MATKNPAAAALGKRRMKLLSPDDRAALGRKGGKARLSKLTPEQRSEIARRGGLAGSAARWGKKKRREVG